MKRADGRGHRYSHGLALGLLAAPASPCILNYHDSGIQAR